MILNFLWSGLRRMWRHRRLIVLFYLFNLLTAASMIWPLRMLLDRVTGPSLIGTSLQQGLPANLLIEFIQYAGSGLGVMFYLWLVLAVLFWIGQLFLSGGALRMYSGKKRFTAKLFWGSAGRYFFRFLRLSFASLLVLAAFLITAELLMLIPRLVFGKSPLAPIAWYLGWIKTALRLFAVLLWLMVFDYARIILVRKNLTKVRKALWASLRFCAAQWADTLLLSLSLVFMTLFCFLVYFTTADQINDTHVLSIILLLIVQQLFMIFRTIIRLTGLAAAISLHQSHSDNKR
jgi:hypothetical protein